MTKEELLKVWGERDFGESETAAFISLFENCSEEEYLSSATQFIEGSFTTPEGKANFITAINLVINRGGEKRTFTVHFADIVNRGVPFPDTT